MLAHCSMASVLVSAMSLSLPSSTVDVATRLERSSCIGTESSSSSSTTAAFIPGATEGRGGGEEERGGIGSEIDLAI